MKDAAREVSVPFRRAVQRALLRWFERERRDLPWRREPTAYGIWVAESMAQQTRLQTVQPHFERFMERFPSIERLARATQDEVLAVWSGLGYYARARNLHKAARLVVERYAGQLPDDPAELQKLPGIGRYTAGAIASIAFGRPVPILDGNVVRLLSRLFGIDDDVGRSATRSRLWSLAAELVPATRPGAFNEAMMELGAMVCTPTAPACKSCPLRARCRAWATGAPEALPVRTPKRPPRAVLVLAAAICREDGAVLLVKNPPHGLFGGLWTLPLYPPDGRSSAAGGKAALARALARRLGAPVAVGQRVCGLEHQLTHRLLRVRLYRCSLRETDLRVDGYAASRWLRSADELSHLGVANLTRKLLDALALAQR